MSYTPYYEGGWKSGEAGGTPITPEALNHMDEGIQDAAPMNYAKMIGAPYNILDNSYFAEVVNQRGQTTYTSGYGIDRWTTALTVTVGDGFVRFANTSTSARVLYFRWPLGTLKAGKIYTFAYKKTDGTVKALTNVCGDGTRTPSAYTEDGIRFGIGANMGECDEMANNFLVGASVDLEWCAVYEGEYTAETLPEYQPKGYAAELAECQRYYWQTSGWTGFNGYKGASAARVMIYLPTVMRATPTFNASVPLRVAVNGTSYTDITVSSVELKGTIVNLFLGTASSIPKDNAIALIPTTAGVISLSADL